MPSVCSIREQVCLCSFVYQAVAHTTNAFLSVRLAKFQRFPWEDLHTLLWSIRQTAYCRWRSKSLTWSSMLWDEPQILHMRLKFQIWIRFPIILMHFVNRINERKAGLIAKLKVDVSGKSSSPLVFWFMREYYLYI